MKSGVCLDKRRNGADRLDFDFDDIWKESRGGVGGNNIFGPPLLKRRCEEEKQPRETRS